MTPLLRALALQEVLSTLDHQPFLPVAAVEHHRRLATSILDRLVHRLVHAQCLGSLDLDVVSIKETANLDL